MLPRRDCIYPPLAAWIIVLAMLGSRIMPSASAGEISDDALAPINARRAGQGSVPLASQATLDAIAKRYVEDMLARRCVCLSARDADAASRLLDDVAAVLPRSGGVRHAGLVVSWSLTAERAITMAAGDRANAAALLDGRLTDAGVAVAVVPPGSAWLVPPPGRDGPDIELTGYALAVIVTASE
jgi:hypothetical protein